MPAKVFTTLELQAPMYFIEISCDRLTQSRAFDKWKENNEWFLNSLYKQKFENGDV